LGIWGVVLVVSVCVGVGGVVLCRCVCVCDLLIFLPEPGALRPLPTDPALPRIAAASVYVGVYMHVYRGQGSLLHPIPVHSG